MSAADIGAFVRHPAAGATRALGSEHLQRVWVGLEPTTIFLLNSHNQANDLPPTPPFPPIPPIPARPPGVQIKECVNAFPYLALEASLQPITRSVLRIQLTLSPEFEWKASGRACRGAGRGRGWGGAAPRGVQVRSAAPFGARWLQ